MNKNRFICLLLLIIASCSSSVKRNSTVPDDVLTENLLWRMHEEVKYAYLKYQDGTEKEGLLLRWEPDSILVQPRGINLPMKIPSAGIVSIKIVTGNRIWETLVAGGALAGGYFALVRGYDIEDFSGWDIAKVIVSPLIIMTSIAVGSAMEKHKEYVVPNDFEFNYEKVKAFHKFME